MKIIKTLKGITRLREENKIKAEIINHLEENFKQLYQTFSKDEKLEDFSLEEHGYFVILEEDKDLEKDKLKEVGLSEGLFNSSFEFVERIELETIIVYKVSILYNNEYLMTFYLEKDNFSLEVEGWLEEHCIDESYFDNQENIDPPF